MKGLLNACCSLALALVPFASAAGMTAPTVAGPRCQVANGEKLPAASGGVHALCAAIERALAAHKSNKRVAVRVTIGARSLLSADVTLSDGRKLPSLKMAEMDRPITKMTFERFGAAIANHIAGSGH